LATKSPRFVKPFPTHRPVTLIRRHKRGGTKWNLIRQPRPRVHARPRWGVRTSYDRESAIEARATKDVRGSLEERIFYQALVNWGFIPGVDFTFQTSLLGGRAELGGLVADFIIEIPKIIINPTSVWHTMTLANIRRDDDQAAILASMGYTVIYLDPNIIHNQTALDLWISNNINMLWGTSSSNGGSGGASDLTYVNDIERRMIENIESLTGSILMVVQTWT